MTEPRIEPPPSKLDTPREDRAPADPAGLDRVCPACGAATEQVKCKVVCTRCRTIVYNCSEF